MSNLKGPLRRIVDRWFIGGACIEKLECGHQQRARRDIAGETNAERRRCWRCRKESEARS